GVRFVAVGAQNDPIPRSGVDWYAGTVGLHHQPTTVAEARQAGDIPRLQGLAGHAVAVVVAAEDNAIRSLLRIADCNFDFGHGVIGSRREGSRHPLLAGTRIRTHDVVT